MVSELDFTAHDHSSVAAICYTPAELSLGIYYHQALHTNLLSTLLLLSIAIGPSSWKSKISLYSVLLPPLSSRFQHQDCLPIFQAILILPKVCILIAIKFLIYFICFFCFLDLWVPYPLDHLLPCRLPISLSMQSLMFIINLASS